MIFLKVVKMNQVNLLEINSFSGVKNRYHSSTTAKQILICCLSMILFACTSNKINPDTTHYIYMSTDKAPSDCKYVGIIHGGHLSNINNNIKLIKNISELHINQAKKLGANYIEMNPSIVGGKAYTCPDAELSKMNGYK